MLPLRVKVNPEGTAVSGYPAFPKGPVLEEPHYQIV